MTFQHRAAAIDDSHVGSLYRTTRRASAELAEGLSDADQTVQSMPDASPAKWHLAHTTWFFEQFILMPNARAYRPYDERFFYLFNSYYEQAGPRYARPRRGMLTRPSADEVLDYRAHVDAALLQLLDGGGLEPAAVALIELGCHHEQQHQELLLTDILHLFAQNPLKPAFRPSRPLDSAASVELAWQAFDGGLVEIGHDGNGFAYDLEGPRHQTFLSPFRLANRLVTNAEWVAFIEDGGYRTPTLWLSDGWAHVSKEGWQAPLYWEPRESDWWTMTLHGPQPIHPDAPVTHVSYYEADAFARWAGKRLPREAEWEHAAASGASFATGREQPGLLMPRPATVGSGLRQMGGDTWEFTGSAFLGYPGFRPAEGAVGEYNGKFMCGQFVLRGSSCATTPGHSRITYRNFFYPHQRWQFTGLRLAEDA